MDASEYDIGLLIGLLVADGHFGGDSKQPQVTLRMHTRHLRLFEWLKRTFPFGQLYGPYHHGNRSYYQWMVRGHDLRFHLLPLLDRHVSPELDAYAYDRYQAMREKYARELWAE